MAAVISAVYMNVVNNLFYIDGNDLNEENDKLSLWNTDIFNLVLRSEGVVQRVFAEVTQVVAINHDVGVRAVTIPLPSFWAWSPPDLWFLRLGPPPRAAWWGCSSACETFPPLRCNCRHSSHTHESSLTHAKKKGVITWTITWGFYVWECKAKPWRQLTFNFFIQGPSEQNG